MTNVFLEYEDQEDLAFSQIPLFKYNYEKLKQLIEILK